MIWLLVSIMLFTVKQLYLGWWSQWAATRCPQNLILDYFWDLPWYSDSVPRSWVWIAIHCALPISMRKLRHAQKWAAQLNSSRLFSKVLLTTGKFHRFKICFRRRWAHLAYKVLKMSERMWLGLRADTIVCPRIYKTFMYLNIHIMTCGSA